MKNFFKKWSIFKKASFANVWRDKYPKWCHIINVIVGAIIAIIYCIFGLKGYSISLRILITVLGIWPLSAAIVFAFSYGVIRARHAWTLRTDTRDLL